MEKNYSLATRKLAICREYNMKPNFSALAKETNINRHTLSDMYYERREFKPRERKSQLDPYKEEIRGILKDPVISVTAAYFYFTDEERRDKVVKCTLSNFLKYVKRHNLDAKEKKYVAHFRYETEPGQQLQVDWVENIQLVTRFGEIIKFNLFSATLGYSRMHYFEFSLSKTEEDFMRCLLHSFCYFGGKTKEVLTDNMSAVVSIDEQGKRNVHPTIAQFFKDLNVELKLCKPRTPQTKGKCETSNKFVKWLYSYNNKLGDELEIFKLINRLNTVINQKVSNQFLGVPPIRYYSKEKELLTELSELDSEKLHTEYARSLKVPQTGLVNYKGKMYSVDKKFIGKRVKNVGDNGKVSIFYNSILIAQHEVKEQKVNYLSEHYSGFLKSKGQDKDDIEEFTKKALERFKNI